MQAAAVAAAAAGAGRPERAFRTGLSELIQGGDNKLGRGDGGTGSEARDAVPPGAPLFDGAGGGRSLLSAAAWNGFATARKGRVLSSPLKVTLPLAALEGIAAAPASASETATAETTPADGGPEEGRGQSRRGLQELCPLGGDFTVASTVYTAADGCYGSVDLFAVDDPYTFMSPVRDVVIVTDRLILRASTLDMALEVRQELALDTCVH